MIGDRESDIAAAKENGLRSAGVLWGYGSREELESVQPDLLNIQGFYQKGRGNFWVAKIAGRVVGTIALIDLGDGQGALRKMFVASGFRGAGSGVAVALLAVLRSWTLEKGFREIFLGTTEKFLAAHRFYEKNGFQEISKSSLPPAFPVMAVDTKFYHLPLG